MPRRPRRQQQGHELQASPAASPRLLTAAQGPGKPTPTGLVSSGWWMRVFAVGWTSGDISQSGVRGEMEEEKANHQGGLLPPKCKPHL